MQRSKLAIATLTLADNFNKLMGIVSGHFGSSPKRTTAGAGVVRAKIRLMAHRKAQADRLKHIDFDAIPPSRQVERSASRVQAKIVRTYEKQQALMKRNKSYPKAV